MASPHLIVPIQVDAFFAEKGDTYVGPDLDFRQLPYFDKKQGIDINPDRPYLIESIVSPPMQNDHLYLKPGVHLHWALPSFLTTTHYASKGQDFPAVPNRWYVAKTIKGVVNTEFIVESDYIWTEEPDCPISDLAIVGLPPGRDIAGKPFAPMGRKWLISDWTNRPKLPKEKYWKGLNEAPLTSIGWGSPAFDTLYAHCRSVFGLHDEAITRIDADVGYTVVGWYEDSTAQSAHQDDYVLEILALCEAEYKQAELDDAIPLGENRETFITRRFQEILHVEIPEGQALLGIKGSIYYGRIKLEDLSKGEPVSNLKVAVGSNATEAISALLVEAMRDKDNATPDTIREEQLEAILSDDSLRARKLDLSSRIKEERHDRGFNPLDTGRKWLVQPVEKTKLGGPVAEQRALPAYSKKVKEALHHLNQAQERYDALQLEYAQQSEVLYADWCRYMLCCYPSEGETFSYLSPDEAMHFIKHNTLARLKQLKYELGLTRLPSLGDSGKFEGFSEAKNAAQVLMGCYNLLKDALDAENHKLDNSKEPFDKRWEVTSTTGTRYFEPTQPVVLLSAAKGDDHSPLSASKRYGQVDRNDINTALKLQLYPVDFTPRKTFSAIAGLLSFAQTNFDKAFGLNAKGINIWHPFRVEWKVAFEPTMADGNEQTERKIVYVQDCILRNFRLPEDDMELALKLQPSGSSPYFEYPNLYEGASFISHRDRDSYKKALEAYRLRYIPSEGGDISLQDLKHLLDRAVKFLNSQDMLTFSLEGFNKALLQLKQIGRIAPQDPLGFKRYQAFTKEIHDAMEWGIGDSPDPNYFFNPIRSGLLKLLSIRMVDTFGRTYDIDLDQPASKIITPTYSRVEGDGQLISLMPRLVQPAAMKAKWIETITEGVQSPICGWIVPNLLDKCIMFFDAKGKHIGNINQNSHWENNIYLAGRSDDSTKPQCDNELLLQCIDWLMQKAEANTAFIPQFLQACKTTMENIQPEYKSSTSVMSVMAGKPMAIVKLSTNLVLRGGAAFDMDWLEFEKDFQRCFRGTNGYTRVKFPMRIGAPHIMNDGLVGYWKLDGPNKLGPQFWMSDMVHASLSDRSGKLPSWFEETELKLRVSVDEQVKFATFLQSIVTNNRISKQAFLKQYMMGGNMLWDALLAANWIKKEPLHGQVIPSVTANELSCSIAEKPQEFVLLMNPRGVLHIQTGILPMRKLSLEEESYKEALRLLEVSFLMSPILMPETQRCMPLHEETEYLWSWIQASKKDGTRTFTRTWQKPFIRQAKFEQAWAAQFISDSDPLIAKDAWDSLIQHGWIVQAEDEFGSYGTLQLPAIELEFSKKDAMSPLATGLSIILPIITEEIRPFPSRAMFYDKLQANEGWLVLNVATTPTQND